MNGGKLLRATRIKMGIGVRELARRAKVPASDISRVENGKQGITVRLARKLAKATDVSAISYLELD